jgi:aryl-alcohol dehydrogenase-like predicted oxidoreductase
VLSGKYVPGEAPPSGSRATDLKGGAEDIADWLTDDVLTRVQLLRPIAAEAGLTMAQLAVAWVLQNDNVAAAIIGASRPEQVAENALAAGVHLDDDTMAAVDKALEGVVTDDPAETHSPAERPSD